MFLCHLARSTGSVRFPRVCGDVPCAKPQPMHKTKFSPRMRGCSGWQRIDATTQLVFPAYAGMFLAKFTTRNNRFSFPRVCGDVPPRRGCCFGQCPFSPRMRGCSSKSNTLIFAKRVFPAYAGMFLFLADAVETFARFPRVCGDVPVGSEIINSAFGFSPRMRGCSAQPKALGPLGHVFPAYAGMFRQLSC